MSIDWSQASCQSYDTELFFSDDVRDLSFAVAVCNVCPIMPACRRYALERREPFGVWGGLTEKERRKLSNRRSRVRCPSCQSHDVVTSPRNPQYEICHMCGLSWQI